MDSPSIKRALISVSDKSNLLPLAEALARRGIEIFSTGGTRRHLSAAGMDVREISAYTGFPELMDGRLKTLHPKVFGGILARHSRPDDLAGLAEHGIHTFELVVVNLYPFEQTIARDGVTDEEAIEQIDIGGPSLLRAAAKNHADITVVTDPDQYAELIQQIAADGRTTRETRRRLAAVAFARTAAYDVAIADYFARDDSFGQEATEFPSEWSTVWQRASILRYGENPHQAAALYRDRQHDRGSLLSAEQLHGKELSYNNYLDLDAALAIVRGLEAPAVSVIKHNNPCGVACGDSLEEAGRAALAGDPTSAFGSVLGCNREVDTALAELLSEPGLFIEAIVAPYFHSDALEILTSRPKWRNNVRLMQLGGMPDPRRRYAVRPIDGGLLVQSADDDHDPTDEWQVVTRAVPTSAQRAELQFAWTVVRHVKSNAIVLTRDHSLVGVGAGQMSRVDSVEIAIRKAGARARGSVLASDAFFPFPDSIELAAQAGVTAVIQPGGSRNDPAVTGACDDRQLPMILTGRRHFKH